MSALTTLPMRDGAITVTALIDLYMSHYAGRDTTRVQRLTWWSNQVGAMRLDELSDDQVHASLEALMRRASRYYAGKDADGRAIYKAKHKPMAPATVNRYSAALAAVITWAIKRRIAPKGYVHPCRSIESQAENNEKTRFLTQDECTRLLEACKASKWRRLYLLVLMALSTGALRGELLGLRWADVDLVQRVAHVGRSKNGDPKVLPIIPAVAEQLAAFAGAPSALVFASTRVPGKAYSFETRWSEVLKAAQIREFTFHGLRNSCASFLVQNGATLVQVADLLGHRQISMSRRYAHLASGDRSALVNRVLGELR